MVRPARRRAAPLTEAHRPGRGSPTCRLHLLRAESAPVACVIRRGPTRWFHVARWDFEADTVEHGAWTRIALYPERCAVSSDGTRLAVFARGGEWGTYFAVSRAPWLRALAAWGTLGTWTTGSHFTRDDVLILAGCAGPSPFHGRYPEGVVCEPVDTWWTRGRLFRELRTGWNVVPLPKGGELSDAADPWLAGLPAPLGASPGAVVVTRPSPSDATRALVLVSLTEGEREYYVREGDRLAPLMEARRAEWGAGDELIVATWSGRLQVLDGRLRCRWEYDMSAALPDPQPAPEWATRPF